MAIADAMELLRCRVGWPPPGFAITSISFSIDRDIASVTGATLGSEAGTSIIFQGGNYYEFAISLTPEVGTWETASMTGLVAANYDLITNLTTDAVDASSHPNFDAGPITFGERTGWTVGPGDPASTAVNVVDNMSYDIISTSSAPEPSTSSLLVVSILLVGAIGLGRKEKRCVWHSTTRCGDESVITSTAPTSKFSVPDLIHLASINTLDSQHIENDEVPIYRYLVRWDSQHRDPSPVRHICQHIPKRRRIT